MNIGIISLGLIGGSLYKILVKKGYKVTAVTRNLDSIKKARQYGAFVSDDMTSLKDCDIVFVCSPMNKTPEILDKLESIVSAKTIVADTCSLKEFVMQKKRPYVFIGSHPMAGTEHSGFDYSFESLFDGAVWVITPFDDTEQRHIEALSSVIEQTGAKVLISDAASHDCAAALISHMPMLLAQALVKSVKDDSLAKKMAASGFRDMTRLALSNTEMACDMISMNSKNISDALINVIESARSLLSDDYKTQVTEIKKIRKTMYDDSGRKNSN